MGGEGDAKLLAGACGVPPSEMAASKRAQPSPPVCAACAPQHTQPAPIWLSKNSPTEYPCPPTINKPHHTAPSRQASLETSPPTHLALQELSHQLVQQPRGGLRRAAVHIVLLALRGGQSKAGQGGAQPRQEVPGSRQAAGRPANSVPAAFTLVNEHNLPAANEQKATLL